MIQRTDKLDVAADGSVRREANTTVGHYALLNLYEEDKNNEAKNYTHNSGHGHRSGDLCRHRV